MGAASAVEDHRRTLQAGVVPRLESRIGAAVDEVSGVLSCVFPSTAAAAVPGTGVNGATNASGGRVGGGGGSRSTAPARRASESRGDGDGDTTSSSPAVDDDASLPALSMEDLMTVVKVWYRGWWPRGASACKLPWDDGYGA